MALPLLEACQGNVFRAILFPMHAAPAEYWMGTLALGEIWNLVNNHSTSRETIHVDIAFIHLEAGYWLLRRVEEMRDGCLACTRPKIALFGEQPGRLLKLLKHQNRLFDQLSNHAQYAGGRRPVNGTMIKGEA